MLLFSKWSLWGCYKARHVTKRDVLLLATLRYASLTMTLFLFSRILAIGVHIFNPYCKTRKLRNTLNLHLTPTESGFYVWVSISRRCLAKLFFCFHQVPDYFLKLGYPLTFTSAELFDNVCFEFSFVKSAFKADLNQKQSLWTFLVLKICFVFIIFSKHS